ncbi:MAG: hypothetical protein JRM85_08960 [Nitrososphaerota archaeon]|nr:hypothetical protein [Nitrososphaerota archaeon]MDG6919249.1 hypothetical protein [Nitrososphaerota archaeon]MDG6946782.1 hypothetical protein [Nitrososphaerota archaeon]
MSQDKRVLQSAAKSLRRVAEVKSEVARKTEASNLARHVEGLTKPKSPSSTMKKAGIALIAAPDPVTGVAGVALLASSFALKNKEPMKVSDIAAETRKLLREIQSFRI